MEDIFCPDCENVYWTLSRNIETDELFAQCSNCGVLIQLVWSEVGGRLVPNWQLRPLTPGTPG